MQSNRASKIEFSLVAVSTVRSSGWVDDQHASTATAKW